MKINLQTGLASHSAAAKSPAKLISFLQEVFKLKAPAAKTMADTLTQISKEKALVTPAIDAFLEFAKTAKQPDIEKAIKSKTVQNLKPVLASIVKNKTFAGTIAAVKNFKFKAPVNKGAKAEFVRQVTLPAPLMKPSGRKISEEYLMTLVSSQAELKREVAKEAKRLGIKATVDAIRDDQSGMGWVATISFDSKADKAKYDKSYNEGMDD